jgi:hypothetical protein
MHWSVCRVKPSVESDETAAGLEAEAEAEAGHKKVDFGAE